MAEEKKEKVVVAMSGGVDSSVALALLKEQGYDCIGVSMQLWDYSEDEGEGDRGAVAGACCSLEDLYDARRVADVLDVPFYVLNMSELFQAEVVDYFTESYRLGRTPNPCVKCNEVLKFAALRKKAHGLGARYLATGHYARLKYVNGRPRLLKGVDPVKDQSYFLFTMSEDELRGTLFPLGSMTKAEVREKARSLGLKTSEKKESQEICFVEGGDYGDFITSQAGGDNLLAAGEIRDSSGKVLGTHSGVFKYTIGQRKGLGIGGSGGPFYVSEIDVVNNRLVVGTCDELYSRGFRGVNASWTGGAASEEAINSSEVMVKIRYGSVEVPCTLSMDSDKSITVTFKEPQKSVTPGQAAVFYRGDEVLGGAWIEEAIR